jgi:hypothetical protein
VAVTDELSSGGNRWREAGAEDGVVETALEELEELVTGRLLAVNCFVVETTELAFVEAVVEAQLLLFEKLLLEVAYLPLHSLFRR